MRSVEAWPGAEGFLRLFDEEDGKSRLACELIFCERSRGFTPVDTEDCRASRSNGARSITFRSEDSPSVG